MAERSRTEKVDGDVPSYFSKLGSGSPKPRQKYGGMFCNVEGAFENKTINFDSLSVGKKSTHRKVKVPDSIASSDGLSESGSETSSVGSMDGHGTADKVDVQRDESGQEEKSPAYTQVMVSKRNCMLYTALKVFPCTSHVYLLIFPL